VWIGQTVVADNVTMTTSMRIAILVRCESPCRHDITDFYISSDDTYLSREHTHVLSVKERSQVQ